MKTIDLSLKVVIILGIIIISVSLSYFFLYRPYLEAKIYKKCFSELQRQNTKDKVFSIENPEKLKLMLEFCVKSDFISGE